MTTGGTVTCAAVDLGAASGRVVLGRVGADVLDVTEVHRVRNEPVRRGGHLCWDVPRLYDAVLDGLAVAARTADVVSVGVDSWAVDYGLLDADGELLGDVVHYRDERTAGLVDDVASVVPRQELYARTGIQFLPINTVYQLVAERADGRLAAARTMLLVPDLLAYWLTGEVGAEVTNASTTALLDVHTGGWATDLAERLGLPARLFPPLRHPGDRIGPLTADARRRTGLPEATQLLAVGSHDTASAVAAVPASGERFAYVSCGTWSLVGVELPAPVLSDESRAANFANERGVDDTVRYLRNVMGLWLLQECLRHWREDGFDADIAWLLRRAGDEPAFAAVVDPDDHAFLPPGDMPARIADACRRTGKAVPATPAATVRCVLESLALGHRRAVRDAVRLSGRDVDIVHIVGGGARNALLCQLTADACDRAVVAGPVEATALGNLLVQARALGRLGDLADLRRLVAATQPTTRYEPRPALVSRWDAVDASVPRTAGSG
ncbi:MAG: rhamnulokinase [Streptosporangiales bacterium]|nr:rhamnulokinase [Streptosporangiales bacterium]